MNHEYNIADDCSRRHPCEIVCAENKRFLWEKLEENAQNLSNWGGTVTYYSAIGKEVIKVIYQLNVNGFWVTVSKSTRILLGKFIQNYPGITG